LPLSQAVMIEPEAVRSVESQLDEAIACDWGDLTSGQTIRRLMRSRLKYLALKGSDCTAAVIEMARRRDDVGDIADDVLLETAREIMDRGEPLHAMLNSYYQDATRRQPRARHKPGSDRTDDMGRDSFIAAAVILVQRKFGLQPTRGTTSQRPSACSVVAKALSNRKLEGRQWTEDTVVKIWTKLGPIILHSVEGNNILEKLPRAIIQTPTD
jgi:hypothetical protein